MNVIPKIHLSAFENGRCVIPKGLTINLGEFSSWCIEAFEKRFASSIGVGDFIRLIKDESLSEEAYVLFLEPNQITVSASNEKGVIWALTTLFHLINNDELQCGKIIDQPKYTYRGLSLDCARHFYSIEEIKKIIETISLVKINKFHWHLTDDQGWRIESKIMPLVQKVSKEYYTQDQIKDIVLYAKIRGVEVIPEIEMPGHVSALLAAYPEYSCSAKPIELIQTGGIFPFILCVSQDKTYHMLDDLFKEILPLFDSQHVHLGGDEVPKMEWKNCPHCQKKMNELGYTNYHDLQSFFTANIVDILKNYGKKAMVWNESLLGNHPLKDVVVQYWTPVHSEVMKPFLKQGGNWIYSDMFDLYFDYPHSMTSLKKVFSTRAHLGMKNLSNHAGLLGMECCLWSERIRDNERLENLLFPRVFALAEYAWSGDTSYSDFEKRLFDLAESSPMNMLSFTNPAFWNMHGAARRKEALAYFQSMFDSMSDEAKKHTNDYAKPSGKFAWMFVRKFFRLLDIPSLLKIMKKQK